MVGEEFTACTRKLSFLLLPIPPPLMQLPCAATQVLCPFHPCNQHTNSHDVLVPAFVWLMPTRNNPDSELRLFPLRLLLQWPKKDCCYCCFGSLCCISLLVEALQDMPWEQHNWMKMYIQMSLPYQWPVFHILISHLKGADYGWMRCLWSSKVSSGLDLKLQAMLLLVFGPRAISRY